MAQRDTLARKDENEFAAANDGYYNNDSAERAANDEYFNNDPVARAAFEERRVTKTVQGGFAGKSLAANAYNSRTIKKTTQRDDDSLQAAQNEARVEEQRRVIAIAEAQVRQTVARQLAVQAGKKIALSAATRSSIWWILSIMGTVYVWQFLFAIMSLAGLGIGAALDDFQKNTLFGKVLSWFVDLKSLVPGELLGMAFWGLCALMSIATFIALVLWFSLRGKSIHNTAVSAMITYLCLSLSILPVTNLLPWLMLWAIYIEMTPSKGGLFSTA